MRVQDSKKRERILDVTSSIVLNEGLRAVSLSKIAKQAEIAPGTIYTYFENKDSMLRELYFSRKKKLAELVSKINEKNDPIEELNNWMDLVYSYGKTNLNDLILLRQFNQSSILNTLSITTKTAVTGFEKLVELVEQGITKGVFSQVNFLVLLAYTYTPVVEYLIAVNNQMIDSEQIPFSIIKKLSQKAILK